MFSIILLVLGIFLSISELEVSAEAYGSERCKNDDKCPQSINSDSADQGVNERTVNSFDSKITDDMPQLPYEQEPVEQILNDLLHKRLWHTISKEQISGVDKRKPSFIRFGRSQHDESNIFKRKPSFIRFGRSQQDGSDTSKLKPSFIRFGRSLKSDYDSVIAKRKPSFIRFGRSLSNEHV